MNYHHYQLQYQKHHQKNHVDQNQNQENQIDRDHQKKEEDPEIVEKKKNHEHYKLHQFKQQIFLLMKMKKFKRMNFKQLQKK